MTPAQPTPRRLPPPLLIAVAVILVIAAGVAGALVFSDGDEGGEGVKAQGSSSTEAPPPETGGTGGTSEPEQSTTTSTTAAPSSTTSAPATTTTSTTAPPPPPSELPGPEGDLAAGAKGRRVADLQKSLASQKYDPGTADGQFGTKTVEAVWAWQALHGLPKTGIVTVDQFNRIIAAEPFAMAQPDLGPNHTEVNLTTQVLVVWRGGNVALATHVSTGSGVAYCEKGYCGDAVTPTGRYSYTRRIDGWREAPLGRLYNPVYFNGGIAVHGAGSVPDYPASHGCVRIPMHIAEYFPSLVANGDAIVVFRS